MTKSEKEHIQYLLTKYLEGGSTEKENALLMSFLDREQDNNEWEEILEELLASEPELREYDRTTWEPVLQTILDRPSVPLQRVEKKINRIVRWAVAATIILIAGAGAYFLFFNEPKNKIAVKNKNERGASNDVAPGGDRAVLTLADGRKIILDSAENGELVDQHGTKIIKIDGQLAYSTEGASAEVLFNTISTPKGGQYQLILSDGSKVWLNAASSLRFPTTFDGTERKVEMTGEAYFEVAHDAEKPFYVSVNETYVQVLGTHFNVMAYDEEGSIKATLLEGSVKVSKQGRIGLLQPGQQAQVSNASANSEIKIVNGVDLEEVVAWKNGLFQFTGADVRTIVRQIGRWYDVEVSFVGDIESAHISGKVSRKLSLLQVIKVLEESGMEIKTDGKKLVAALKQ